MSTELLTDDTIAKLRQLNVSYDFFDWLQDDYEDLHTEYNDLGLEIYNLSNGKISVKRIIFLKKAAEVVVKFEEAVAIIVEMR